VFEPCREDSRKTGDRREISLTVLRDERPSSALFISRPAVGGLKPSPSEIEACGLGYSMRDNPGDFQLGIVLGGFRFGPFLWQSNFPLAVALMASGF
jgi:hypothetical protein